MSATLTLSGVPVQVQTVRQRIAEARNNVPLKLALFVRDDAVARIYGVRRIYREPDGSLTYVLCFIYEGDGRGLMHDTTEGFEVNHNTKTWQKKPALLGVVDTPDEFGMSDKMVDDLIKTGKTLPGYKGRRTTKRYRSDIGRRG